jgi:hypothetical protein
MQSDWLCWISVYIPFPGFAITTMKHRLPYLRNFLVQLKSPAVTAEEQGAALREVEVHVEGNKGT